MALPKERCSGLPSNDGFSMLRKLQIVFPTIIGIVGLALCQRIPVSPPPAPTPSPPPGATESPPSATPRIPSSPEPSPPWTLRFQWGFQDYPLHAAWSPRRPWLALASANRLYVYHFPSLRLLAFFTAETPWLEIAFAADGETLIGRTDNGTLIGWDIPSRQARWSRSDMPGIGIAASPSGQIALGHGDGSVRLLDPLTGWEIRRLPDGVPLSFSPDGELVVVCPNPEWLDPLLIRCSPSEDLQIIEQKSGRTRYTVRSGVPPIWLDARRVLVGRADGAVWEVDLPSGIERKVWSRPRATIRQIMLSPDQRWLAVQYGGSVDIVERMTGVVRWSEAGGPFAFSPEGSWMAWVRGMPPTLTLLDLQTGADRPLAAGTLEVHWPRHLSFSPDGRWLLFQGEEAISLTRSRLIAPIVQIWEVTTGIERYRFLPRLAPIWDLAFSPDGRTLGMPEGAFLRRFDTETGREQLRLPLRIADGLCLAFSPDGRWLAVGLANGYIRLYRRISGEERLIDQIWIGHQGPVRAVAFSPDSRLLASASWDRTVRIWDVESGQERMRLEGHTAEVWDVAFSPDGQMVISAGQDGTLRLGWEAAGGGRSLVLATYGVPVYQVAFSPDGRWLAAGLGDGTVRIWDMVSRVETRVLAIGAKAVRALAFAPDGQLLAAGNEAGQLILWVVSEDREQTRWTQPGDALYALTFSPDGRRLALGFRSGVAQVWERP